MNNVEERSKKNSSHTKKQLSLTISVYLIKLEQALRYFFNMIKYIEILKLRELMINQY